MFRYDPRCFFAFSEANVKSLDLTPFYFSARFDDTEIEGMPSSTAYVDLRKMSPNELAKLIQEKLRE